MSDDISTSPSASTKTFVTALVFNSAVFGIEIAAFTLLRPYFKAIYEPRTYVPAPSKRIQPLSKNIFYWPIAVFKADYNDIINANGMDAYFFVRFLRMMVKIFLPIWILSWAILLPVTSVNSRVGNNEKLDILVFGNVATNKQQRYAAHIILAWLFTAWVLYNIKNEMRNFIIKRQQFLINPVHSKSVQAKTILVTGIPAKYLSQEGLMKIFGELPGGVKRIFINHNLKELPDVYDRRLDACNKLESAENKLLSIATKSDKTSSEETAAAVPQDKRPTHRLGFLGLWGKKVDSIDWAREEIQKCSQLLDEGRAKLEDESDTTYPPLNSAFITFNRQIAAHLGMQVLLHHEPYRMSGRYTEVAPDDVIWANLGMNPYEMKVRLVISYSLTAALIILWAFPVAFVGIVSNVYTLCSTASWLAWICTLPGPVLGIISGILPPVALAVLMMLLPIVLRLLARFEGIPEKTGLELSLMTRYFIFQVIHSFLIVTVSAGIIASLDGLINNPTSIPTLLAQNLPTSSTFFLTYVILQGLSGTASGFLQIVPLAIYYVKLYLLGSTPRSIWGIKYGARNVAWGTLFPGITLLTTITLGYSIISPIINGLACATFFLFYQLYKYLFLWQFQQPDDTGGLFFPKAMQHIFVGLYVEQVCLCALFFLARDENGKTSAVAEGALMVVLIIFTVFFHLIINNSYDPLIHALPLSLVEKMEAAQVDEEEEDLPNRTGSKTRLAPNSSQQDKPESADRPEKEKIASTNSDGDSEGSHDSGGGVTKEYDFMAAKNMKERQKEEDSYGFAHPAASRPQRIVWLPLAHGAVGELSKSEARECLDRGVIVSLVDAEMNEKGKVDITGPPPDLVREE
ncbi:hypothetical protein IW261DRAFT_1341695 [Armillaria novae-zelandiae]|uniref:DUF221-domain-containing protein n=1 Tax=Armillaria novae-zelandiae TaxID=153914 RepID=A0AA39NYE2_9AGAR|nr:hypothetical protein IW261DRAFT_1341695 [Armillaria novae-zelandiae]